MAKNETAKKRYVVAEGFSFVGKKRSYVSGDEIDESAFGKAEYFKKMIAARKIIEAPPEDEPKKEPEKGKGSDSKTETRKALEEKAISGGLLDQEALAQFTDEQLEKLLKGNGIA
jgi:hypothetical protein